MENITETAQKSENIEQQPKITLANRYIHLAKPHNRIWRIAFIVNIIILANLTSVLYSLIHNFIPVIDTAKFLRLIISLVFVFFCTVQFTKRLHDFGASGKWTIGIFLYNITVSTGWFFLGLPLNISVFLVTYSYVLILLPIIILGIIPGNAGENTYGKPQKF